MNLVYLYHEILSLLSGHRLGGFTGATTRGLPYFVDDSDALQAMTSASDVWGKLWGIGTGQTGVIQVRGTMPGLGAMTAGVQWVQATQILGTTPGAPGRYPAGLVRANANTVLHIDIRWTPETTPA